MRPLNIVVAYIIQRRANRRAGSMRISARRQIFSHRFPLNGPPFSLIFAILKKFLICGYAELCRRTHSIPFLLIAPSPRSVALFDNYRSVDSCCAILALFIKIITLNSVECDVIFRVVFLNIRF